MKHVYSRAETFNKCDIEEYKSRDTWSEGGGVCAQPLYPLLDPALLTNRLSSCDTNWKLKYQDSHQTHYRVRLGNRKHVDLVRLYPCTFLEVYQTAAITVHF